MQFTVSYFEAIITDIISSHHSAMSRKKTLLSNSNFLSILKVSHFTPHATYRELQFLRHAEPRSQSCWLFPLPFPRCHRGHHRWLAVNCSHNPFFCSRSTGNLYRLCTSFLFHLQRVFYVSAANGKAVLLYIFLNFTFTYALLHSLILLQMTSSWINAFSLFAGFPMSSSLKRVLRFYRLQSFSQFSGGFMLWTPSGTREKKRKSIVN